MRQFAEHEGECNDQPPPPEESDASSPQRSSTGLSTIRVACGFPSLSTAGPPAAVVAVHQRWNSFRGSSHTPSVAGSTTPPRVLATPTANAVFSVPGHPEARGNFRAGAATLVFTHSAGDDVRRSPSLENALPLPTLGCGGGNASFSRVPSDMVPAQHLSAASDEVPQSAGKIRSSGKLCSGCYVGSTQEAEPLDLYFTRSPLPTSRGHNTTCGNVGILREDEVGVLGCPSSDEACSMGASCEGRREQGVHCGAVTSFGREAAFSHANGGLVPPKGNIFSGVVEYRYIEVQAIDDPGGGGSDPMQSNRNGCGRCGSRRGCFLSSCCALFCVCGGGGPGRGKVEGERDADVWVESSPCTTEAVGGQCTGFTGSFFNAFSTANSPVALIFWLLNFTAVVSTVLAGVLHFLFTFGEQKSRVSDSSVCNGIVVQEAFTPNMAFAFICFSVNSLAAACFALHAVRRECIGSLFCHFFAVVLLVGCLVNYTFSRSSSTFSRNVEVWFVVVLFTNSVLLLISCCLYGPVTKTFSWRLLMKGVARTESYQRRCRGVGVVSCTNIDLVATMNGGVAALYLASGRAEVLGSVFLTLLSASLTLLFTSMLERRVQSFIVLFVMVAAATTGFNCYLATHGVYEYFITDALNNYEVSRCYTNGLQYCMWNNHIQMSRNFGSCSHSEPGGSSNLTNTTRSVSDQVIGKDGPYGEPGTCCLDYGECRLLDPVRFYASGFIAVLVVFIGVVRLALVRLWFYMAVEDSGCLRVTPLVQTCDGDERTLKE